MQSSTSTPPPDPAAATPAHPRAAAGAGGKAPGRSPEHASGVPASRAHVGASSGSGGSGNRSGKASGVSSITRAGSSIQVPARRSITVAVGQFHHGKNRTVQDNTKTIINFIEKAAKSGAQVVTFHETATTGYSASAIRDNGHAMLIECERAIAAACRSHSVACVLGTAHFSERHGTIHNTALVIDDKGRFICRQSKLQLVPTDHWAVPGDDLCTFRIAGVECCAVVCHDIRHPELVRLCAIKGAQVLFYISWETNLDDAPIPLDDAQTLSVYRAQVQARAVENHIYVVHANAAACTADRDLGSHGMSRIVSPTGHILAEACPDKEELLVHRLTLTEAHRAHALESLRDSYFLKDWYISGVRSLFEATIPPESPHIRGHGVPGIPRSSSRGGSPRSASPRSIGLSRSSAFGRLGGGSVSLVGGTISHTSRRRTSVPSQGRSPTSSPNLSLYKRRRIDTLPIDYSSDSSDGTRTASRSSGSKFFMVAGGS